MVWSVSNREKSNPTLDAESIRRLRQSINRKGDSAKLLVEAMATWTTTQEVYQGQLYNYLIGGEAFDWLLLAQRLCDSVRDIVPRSEREKLLLHKYFYSVYSPDLKRVLGVDKHRACLNYYYGVTVETALQLATEIEVRKRRSSNGILYRKDDSEKAFKKIYGRTKRNLLAIYRHDSNLYSRHLTTTGRTKAFTYWLFKYRLKVSEKAKIASDTRKGIDHLYKHLKLTN